MADSDSENEPRLALSHFVNNVNPGIPKKNSSTVPPFFSQFYVPIQDTFVPCSSRSCNQAPDRGCVINCSYLYLTGFAKRYLQNLTCH